MYQDLKIPFDNYEIPVRLRCPNDDQKHPAVVFLHGFNSCKEGDANMLEMLAERLLAIGYVVMQVDCYSCGTSIETKEEYTLTQLCKEADFLFSYLQKLDGVDANKCGMVGHSFGGRVACMLSNPNIHFIITLNGAMGDKYRAPWFFKEDMYRMQEECRLYGKTEFRGATFYQKLLVDMERSSTDAIFEYPNHLLIVYGSGDPTVDHRVSLEIIDKTNCDFVRVENANHTFQAKTGDYTVWKDTMQRIIDWLQTI